MPAHADKFRNTLTEFVLWALWPVLGALAPMGRLARRGARWVSQTVADYSRADLPGDGTLQAQAQRWVVLFVSTGLLGLALGVALAWVI